MNTSEWSGLYRESWNGDLTPESYQHPAKVQPALARRIVEHAIEQGYITPGSTVVDPFGGIAGFALACMRQGVNWIGVELEPKFVELAQANIDLWESRYRPHFPGMGTARILQGDSRRLCEVVAAAGAVVSSPPYAGTTGHDGGCVRLDGTEDERRAREGYGRRPGYGSTPGQLEALRDAGLDAAISSPPYSSVIDGNGEGPGARYDHICHNGDNATKKSSANGYGTTEGNLGGMVEGDAVISSPPFESSDNRGASNGIDNSDWRARRKSAGAMCLVGYEDEANIGNDQGETFWAAARQILEQVYQILRPGGAAIWVCGDFVRNGERVHFGRQWLALCQACGFEPLEWITAWKVERRGEQLDIFGNVHQRDVQRVSFFRRLANERNPEAAILNEDVIIVRKPGGTGDAEAAGAAGAISSPPYAENGLHGRPSSRDAEFFGGRTLEHGLAIYGSSPGQLGSMPEGDAPEERQP
jgi:DNA modification methylase